MGHGTARSGRLVCNQEISARFESEMLHHKGDKMKPLHVLGKVIKWIIPKTINRLVALDLLLRKNSQFKKMRVRHKECGFSGESFAEAYNLNAEKFNKNKYFWMKRVERIEKEKTGENT